MRYGKLCLAILLTGFCAASVSSQAQTYYSNRALFNAANPGLTLETFDSLLTQVVTGPYVTPSAGLSIDAIGPNPEQIYINSFYGFSLDTSVVATTNYFGDTADVLFTNNNVTAAGLDLYNGVYTINIFGAGNALLGTQTVDASSGAFFGVSASQTITHISFNNATTYETYDNIAFGGAAPMSTPEPGSLALLAGMGLSGAGFLARRRKNARQVA